MNRSFSKKRHIQEANRRLEDRIIAEGLKVALNEAYLPLIQEGDDLCEIICYRKQAKFGSNGDAVKKIQNGLAKCGHNPNKMGGGMNQGCGEDWTKCDGKFREETKKAVEDFQKANGLKVDGAVGIGTLRAMGKKCLQLPDCDCKAPVDRDTNVTDDTTKGTQEPQDWWTLIDGGNESMNDCNQINRCLYKALKRCRKTDVQNCFSNTFFECMRGQEKKTPESSKKCGNCPKYINRMPGPYQKPLSSWEERCIESGCSKIAV